MAPPIRRALRARTGRSPGEGSVVYRSLMLSRTDSPCGILTGAGPLRRHTSSHAHATSTAHADRTARKHVPSPRAQTLGYGARAARCARPRPRPGACRGGAGSIPKADDSVAFRGSEAGTSRPSFFSFFPHEWEVREGWGEGRGKEEGDGRTDGGVRRRSSGGQTGRLGGRRQKGMFAGAVRAVPGQRSAHAPRLHGCRGQRRHARAPRGGGPSHGLRLFVCCHAAVVHMPVTHVDTLCSGYAREWT